MARIYSLLLAAALAFSAVMDMTRAACMTTAPSKPTTIVITMSEGTDKVLTNQKARSFKSHGERSTAVAGALEAHALERQEALITHLVEQQAKKDGSTYDSSTTIWLTNQLLVHNASPQLIQKLLTFGKTKQSIKCIEADMIMPMSMPVVSTASVVTTNAAGAQWGVKMINAPAVWGTGNVGDGVTVGIIDSGALSTHSAIAPSFKSTFNWYDPEKKLLTPYDTTGHGTHVTGIIAGQNGYGVAPGASWIMCKGCRSNGCYTSDLLACFQFMQCPSTPDGLTKDCTQAPRVVNNSWGGGQGITSFDAVIAAWRAAGIIPVFASGNTGPACSTVQSPGDSASVLTIGATTSLNNLASFSSKGPSTRGLQKPDVSAPGNSILSSCYTGPNDYCTKSGTSMASPHVTGAIALYLSAKPTATYTQIKSAFQLTAVTTIGATGYTCGGTLDSVLPNNQYGMGRIDIFKALA